MAGLLDFFTGNSAPPTPQQMGLLGMAAAMSNAYAPQGASRLPLAKPNMAYLLGQGAGGYGQGYGAGLNQQLVGAQTQAAQLKNLNDIVTYNLWAPYLGQQPINTGANGGVPIQGINPNAPSPQIAPPAAGNAPTMPPIFGGGFAPQAGAPGGPAPIPNAPNVPPTPAPIPNLPNAPGPQGTPTPTGQSNGSPSLANLYQLPPPLLQRMGIPVPPELTAAFAAGIQPGTPQWQTLANNAALKSSGINPMIGGDRPGVPAQQASLGPNGQLQYNVVPGQLEAMTAGAMTQVPAKAAEAWNNQRARVAAEAQIQANTFRNQYGAEPPTNISQATNQKMAAPQEPIITPSGSAVPAPDLQRSGLGGKQLDAQIAETTKTKENWNSVRPSLDQADTQMLALAKLFQTTEAGGLNERKAQVANTLRGLGLGGLADQIMSAQDTAHIQSAAWLGMQDVMRNLKAINQGTGGRILNSEFEAFMNHAYNPDMDPRALHSAISQQLGVVRQTRQMIDDWYNVAEPGGWNDANHYQSAYLSDKRNAMGRYVDEAGKEIGSFKGMPTANASAPPSGAVKALQMNPALASQFDAKYGPGTSARYLKSTPAYSRPIP